MKEFFCSAGLWENIIGGVIAAVLIALFSLIKNCRKHKILKDLTIIMGKAIKHRNLGENFDPENELEWIQRAKEIENEAIKKAQQLSSTAGSLVEWLDRVPPWNSKSEVEKYISILSKVIDRIRELLERNS